MEVTFIHNLVGTSSSPLWCAKAIGSQSTDLLELPAPCSGMSELLAPKEVTSVEFEGRFLTIGESLPPVVFSASPGWLILPAHCGGMPEPLASRELISVNDKGRSLTTGELPVPVVFLASLGWLILSASQGGMLSELLAPS
jgi:hypothetical protein